MSSTFIFFGNKTLCFANVVEQTNDKCFGYHITIIQDITDIRKKSAGKGHKQYKQSILERHAAIWVISDYSY